MNTSYAGNEPRERIYARGAIVLAGAEALELMGFMVDLRLFELSYVDKDVHFSEYRLKLPDERVNLQKLYFPLCHPSWVRRLNFHLIECSPNMTEAWASCYGISAETPLIKRVLGLGEGGYPDSDHRRDEARRRRRPGRCRQALRAHERGPSS